MKKTEYDRLYARLLNEFNEEKENLMLILKSEHPEQELFFDEWIRSTHTAYLRLAALKSIEPYV